MSARPVQIEVEVGVRVVGSKEFITAHLDVFSTPVSPHDLTIRLVALEKNVRDAVLKLGGKS